MSTTFDHRSEKNLFEVESSGALVEAIGGLSVIVLSILGLAGLVPDFLAAIAGIVVGVSIFSQGAAVAGEYHNLYSRLAGGAVGAVELGAGMSIEILAGAAAIVLGIIALIPIRPDILLPALVIAAGAALILSAGTVQRLNNLKIAAAETPALAQQVMRTTTGGAAAGQLLAGMAAGVLGIIALASLPSGAAAAGATSATLTLIALLVLGASILMSGGSLAARFVQMFNREGEASHS